MIITLHGFGTTGEGSHLCQAIDALAKENGELSFVPTYPTNNPHLAYIYLANYLSRKMGDYNSVPTLIGFDLGGFWARHLALLCAPEKLILINPDMAPWKSLGPYVGTNKNSGTGEKFQLAMNDIAAFHAYRCEKDRLDLKLNLILSSDDEIFDAETTIKQFVSVQKQTVSILEGGHSFKNDYSEVLQLIKNDLFPEPEEEEESQ